jgi:ribosomal protein S18 acetylase RimI-like enzyme
VSATLRGRRSLGLGPSTFEAFNEDLHAGGVDPSLVFLAEANGRVVGHIVSFLDENEGFAAMLGVIQPWRGRGIAKALLRRACAEFSIRDRTQVKLGVAAQNPNGAVALYEGVGMTVERRYDIFELATPSLPLCATNGAALVRDHAASRARPALSARSWSTPGQGADRIQRYSPVHL